MKKHPLKSRKFWVGICTFIALLASEILGVELDAVSLAAIVIPVVAWIIGESVIDARAVKKE